MKSALTFALLISLVCSVSSAKLVCETAFSEDVSFLPTIYKSPVNLGKISEQRFNELQSAFGEIAVRKYDANQTYDLQDFFPSFMRKVNGKHLVDHKLPVSDQMLTAARAEGLTFGVEEGSDSPFAFVDANCHSLTWQWINHIQGRGSKETLFALADGDTLANLIAQAPNVKKKDLKIGDVVFFVGKSGPRQKTPSALHSAIYIGDGLIFEKANPGVDFPFHVARLDEVTESYKEFSVGTLKVVFKRPREMPSKLETLVENLSLGNKTQVAELGDKFKFSSLSQAVRNQYSISAERDKPWMEPTLYVMRLLTTQDVAPENLREQSTKKKTAPWSGPPKKRPPRGAVFNGPRELPRGSFVRSAFSLR